MVTSVASRFCRILFLMGGLHLPHWKVEALSSHILKTNMVYQMYLNGMDAPGNVPVHYNINGRITQTFIECRMAEYPSWV